MKIEDAAKLEGVVEFIRKQVTKEKMLLFIKIDIMNYSNLRNLITN